MGCSIHIVTEIKKSGKWMFVEDVPPSFDTRDYLLYSVLAGVRNSFDTKGFAPRGLPSDISATKFRFESYSEYAEKRYHSDEDGSIMFLDEHGNWHKPDSISQSILTKEEYESLRNELNASRDNFAKQYYMLSSTFDGNTHRYSVYDAYAQGGRYERVPFYKIFSQFADFLGEYYADDWDETAQDYGRWCVDFECEDYHSASYLSLADFLNADFSDYYSHKYKMDVSFYEAFKRLGGVLPDGMREEKYEPDTFVDIIQYSFAPTTMIVWEQSDEEKQNTSLYKGIQQLKEIAQRYDISNPEDIRIVFAFDN